MCAQAAHASISFLKDALYVDHDRSPAPEEQTKWLEEGMTKICVRAESEEELMEIYQAARAAKLEVHLITDAGLTEFDGPTKTCLAIGPDLAEKIDKITGGLKLL